MGRTSRQRVRWSGRSRKSETVQVLVLFFLGVTILLGVGYAYLWNKDGVPHPLLQP